jgi:hypothetical protein
VKNVPSSDVSKGLRATPSVFSNFGFNNMPHHHIESLAGAEAPATAAGSNETPTDRLGLPPSTQQPHNPLIYITEQRSRFMDVEATS